MGYPVQLAFVSPAMGIIDTNVEIIARYCLGGKSVLKPGIHHTETFADNL